MRVALTLTQCWHPIPGGTATAAVGLARALDARVDVDVIGIGPRSSTAPTLDPGVPLVHLGTPYRLLYDLWHRGRQAPETVSGPVDIVHATAPVTPPVRSAPLVMTLHDLFPVLEPDVLTRRGVRLMTRALELARERATVVMCSSQQTLDDAVDFGFDPDRLRLVPLGVEDRIVDAADRSRVRAAHGLVRPFVLWVGTIEPRKNLPAFIDAFLAAGLDDVDLILAGPQGWNESIGAALDRSGGRVRHLGFVPGPDLPALMAEARVLALPSHREGFGLPALEAMVHGTPVIGSAGTAVAEVVADTGLLVAPSDRNGWVDAVRQAASDDSWRDAQANAARSRALTYSWERTAAATVDAYRDAITAGPRSPGSVAHGRPRSPGSVVHGRPRPSGSVVAVMAVPPPVTGQSVASQMLIEGASRRGVDVVVLDLSSDLVRSGWRGDVRRLGAAARRTLSVLRTGHGPDGRRPVLYVQLGQGPASMLRDLPVLAAARVRGLPVVGHVHGGGWRAGSDRLPAPLRAVYRAAVGRSTRIIVLTERLRSQFDGVVEADRVRVVGNGVDAGLAEAAAAEPASWSDPPTATFLANLLPGKGASTVAAAARLALERGSDLRFVIAGAAAGDDVSDFADVAALDIVGAVDRDAKIALLRRSHVLLLPTSYWVEGEPISLLEGFHFGVPAVSCDRGGIADIVDDVTGVLIAPDDPAALLDAVMALTADRRTWEARSAAIAERARERHSTDEHVDGVLAVLAEAGLGTADDGHRRQG